jgi:heme/copper-type cytochrome/quinol oxidase subunit 2
VIVYSVIAFQPTDSGSGVKAPRDTTRELAWTMVPIAIVIAAAAPAMTNFASGNQASMAHELQGCGERRSCRAYSLSQLINHGADHCAVLANAGVRATSLKTSPQIAATCSAHR